MAEQPESLDDRVASATTKAIREYLATGEFKDRLVAEYKQQIGAVIKKSEESARWGAALAGLLILSVFTVLLLLQYADIRTKQADLYEKYAAANELVGRINTRAATLDEEVQAKLKSVQELTTRLGQFETRLVASESAANRLSQRPR
jgi:hypothetical protein